VAAEAQDASAPVTRWERLLDLDGDLADTLGAVVAARARDRIGVATVQFEAGSWRPHALTPAARRAFALLVCDGLIVRELELAGTLTADLLGPGDLVAFGLSGERLLATEERWHVSAAAKVAILDDRVLPAFHAWPVLSSRLVTRAARQAARAADQRAISQLPRVELRIRALLWHLAERWGRIGSSGVVVPLDLTHTALGHLVGARRSTVTLALGELSRLGSVVRRSDGAWVLSEESNPSGGPRRPDAALGIAAIGSAAGGQRATRHAVARSILSADMPALIERVDHVRALCAREHARTLEIMARCRTTRDHTARRREGRVSPRLPGEAPPS
jgi:CRP/FNR family transcriptional regulator, cyclic AMP receptor protein